MRFQKANPIYRRTQTNAKTTNRWQLAKSIDKSPTMKI
jgi:hypothetical protein